MNEPTRILIDSYKSRETVDRRHEQRCTCKHEVGWHFLEVKDCLVVGCKCQWFKLAERRSAGTPEQQG